MNIPENALYGIWDYEKEEWTGEWAFTENEGSSLVRGVGSSGFDNLEVLGVNGTDDSWIERYQW